MEHGIKKINDTVFCANCGQIISQTPLFESYCQFCGNPLRLESIIKTKEALTKLETDFAKKIKIFAKEKQTDSLSEVFKLLKL